MLERDALAITYTHLPQDITKSLVGADSLSEHDKTTHVKVKMLTDKPDLQENILPVNYITVRLLITVRDIFITKDKNKQKTGSTQMTEFYPE